MIVLGMNGTIPPLVSTEMLFSSRIFRSYSHGNVSFLRSSKITISCPSYPLNHFVPEWMYVLSVVRAIW